MLSSLRPPRPTANPTAAAAAAASSSSSDSSDDSSDLGGADDGLDDWLDEDDLKQAEEPPQESEAEMKATADAVAAKLGGILAAQKNLNLLTNMSKMKLKLQKTRKNIAARKAPVVQESSHVKIQNTTSAAGEQQKKINDYTMKQDLGEGKFGKVRLAANSKGDQFAIKIMNKNKLASVVMSFGGGVGSGVAAGTGSGSAAGGGTGTGGSGVETALDSVRMEIVIMKKLEHENLVSLHEVIDDPEHSKIYLVLQLASGEITDIVKPIAQCADVTADEYEATLRALTLAALAGLD
eukprot:g100.t1